MKENLNNIAEQYLKKIRDYEEFNKQLIDDTLDWENIEEVSKEVAEKFYNEYMNVINESKFIE